MINVRSLLLIGMVKIDQALSKEHREHKKAINSLL